jgi:hypothetical protein
LVTRVVGPSSQSSPVAFLTAATAGIAFLRIIAGSRDIKCLNWNIELAIIVVLALVPLCYAVFLPSRYRTPDGVYQLPFTFWLGVFVVGLVCWAWMQLWNIRRVWMVSAVAQMPLDSMLSALCVAAPAVYSGILYYGIPALSSDHFHTGEQIVSWQQPLNFRFVRKNHG